MKLYNFEKEENNWDEREEGLSSRNYNKFIKLLYYRLTKMDTDPFTPSEGQIPTPG